MADRGFELCEDEHGYFLWKRCEVEGCPNLICERRSPIFCWPHSDSGKTLSEVIEDIAEPVNNSPQAVSESGTRTGDENA